MANTIQDLPKRRSNSQSKARIQQVSWLMPLTKQNYMLIAGSVGIIVLGYILLSLGISNGWDYPLSVNVAPVVLVLGYCVALPIALLWRPRTSEPS